MEKMKLSKNKFTTNLKQKSWLQVLMDIGGKYGFYLILKRFIRFCMCRAKTLGFFSQKG